MSDDITICFTELGAFCGSEMVFDRQFVGEKEGTESVKDEAKSTLDATVIGKANEIIGNDGRCSIREIIKAVVISLLRVHFILNRNFALPDGYRIY